MKKTILFATVLFAAYAGFGQKEIPAEWRLNPKEARAMMRYYTDCAGNCFTSKAKADTAKENLIRGMYPNAQSFGWVDARYRAADQVRYANRNLRQLKSGGDQIGGYTTQLFKVVDADGSTYFFDIVTICPPPSVCDSEEE